MTTRHEPAVHEPAADARSILACPDSIRLDVHRLAFALDEVVIDADDQLPVLLAPPGSPLSRAAAEHGYAALRLASGLGRPGEASRDMSLTLGGTLEARSVDLCQCCQEQRTIIAVHLDEVVLVRDPQDPDTWVDVPPERFLAPEHHLNRGYLQRTVEHANESHQDDLRQAVATATSTRGADVVGVALDELTPHGVAVHWVDTHGAHRHRLAFDPPARTPTELGDALRRLLHAGIC